MAALKDSLAEAMGKFSPDRTVLPIPDRSFGGTIGRTMDQSVADWTIVPGAKAPDNAPFICSVFMIRCPGFAYFCCGSIERRKKPTPMISGSPPCHATTTSGGPLVRP
jgi:hypothetical protein